MIPFEEFEKRAALIPYQYRHPFFIYSLIRWLNISTAIEIGTHIGMTAVWMARGIQENGGGVLCCIDPFCWTDEKQEEQWRSNVSACGVNQFVRLIKGRSQEVEWPKAELVFVDGNHTYQVAKHDAEKARNSGARVVILHDTVAWEGSRLHAEEIRSDLNWADWDKLEVNFDCGIMVLLKREPKPPSSGEDIGEKWDVNTSKNSASNAVNQPTNQHKMILLNLGCGGTWPPSPWVNVDSWEGGGSNNSAPPNFLNHDLRNPLPYADNSIDGAFANHLVEHLDAQEAKKLFEEVRRVLMPGGLWCVGVPNASYHRKVWPEDTRANSQRLFGEPIPDGDPVTNNLRRALFFEQHKQILTEDSLWCHFVVAGFPAENIQLFDARAVHTDWRLAQFQTICNRIPFTLLMVAAK